MQQFVFIMRVECRAYDLDLSKMILSEDDKPIIHTHNYIEESRTEATCLSPSIVTYRCDGCGGGYIVQEGERQIMYL